MSDILSGRIQRQATDIVETPPARPIDFLRRVNAPDLLTLSYLTLTLMLLLGCRAVIPGWPQLALIHTVLIVMIVMLVSFRVSTDRLRVCRTPAPHSIDRTSCPTLQPAVRCPTDSQSVGGSLKTSLKIDSGTMFSGTIGDRLPRLLFVLSHWYPLLLPGFFFEEVGRLVHAFWPGWFDSYLIAADHALLGVHPTVWIERFSSYWLTEYLQFTYTLYLPLIPACGLLLWWRKRHDQFTAFATALCLTYYLNYVIFVLFPIEGPFHTLAALQQTPLHGGPLTALIELIEKHGRVHGGAFPSNHIAGTMVVQLCALSYCRRVGYALIPLTLSICIATIYGRYHYFSDVLAGMLMAIIGWRVTPTARRLCAGIVSTMNAS